MTRPPAAVAILALCVSLARAQDFPPAQDVGVNLQPEPRSVRAIASGRALRLTLTPLPPGAVDPLPSGRPLNLALTPLNPPPIATLPAAKALRLTVSPLAPADVAALPSGRMLRLQVPPLPTGPADPAALAAVATANLPVPQPLSVTLAPPPSALSAIASVDFPGPQPLLLTLVPPTTALAAVGGAEFASAQQLTVTLYAGEALQAATLVGGLAPVLTLAPPIYTAQIVQAIPRRGVDFFDRRNPAGQPATQFAALGAPGGGASACAPGPTSGGTFQSVFPGPYPLDLECHSLAVVSDPAGQGDVLAMGDFHMIFANPGATLSAAVNVNSGPNFATLTGPNASTMSITGVTSAPQGSVPAGTPMRIDGTANNVTVNFTNYTLTVCTAAGPVVYRRPAGDCN